MSYYSESEKLFNEWKKKIPEYSKCFVKDGIISFEDFENQKTKILFLMKEVNDPSAEADWDIRETFSQELKHSFAIRLAEWSWGILNNFPPIEKASREELHKSLKKVSIVNVKKSGGGSSTDMNELIKHIKKNKEFLLKQISIIDPDIIVSGLGDTNNWKLLYDDIELVQSGYDIKITRYNKFKIIDYYHPSYQVPRAMSYSLLKNIIQSDKFQKL